MVGLLLELGVDPNLRDPIYLNAPNRGGNTRVNRALARGWIDFAGVTRGHGARTAAELTARTSD